MWPNGKKFAFTIIDDTDNSSIENVKAIYDFLNAINIKTTKTAWVFPSRDKFKGETLQDEVYKDFLLDLKEKGFEIALHGVGSGSFKREEIIKGISFFKEVLGQYPAMHINHSQNNDNLYWGHKRFGFFLSYFHKILVQNRSVFSGDSEGSKHFWGDFSAMKIKYVRNRVYNGINTLRYDKHMPYKEKNKPYVNYWFSASDGHTVEEFLNLTKHRKIDALEREGGLCVIYTHFASGFLDDNGEVNREFVQQMNYLASREGWFAPASEIFNFIQKKRGKDIYISSLQTFKMDLIWVVHRLLKRIKFSR